jgi:hypothetical protein
MEISSSRRKTVHGLISLRIERDGSQIGVVNPSQARFRLQELEGQANGYRVPECTSANPF